MFLQIILFPVTSRDGDKNSLQEKKYLINPDDISSAVTVTRDGVKARLRGRLEGREGNLHYFTQHEIKESNSKSLWESLTVRSRGLGVKISHVTESFTRVRQVK